MTVELKNIRKEIAGRLVLDDVSLHIDAGEVVGLLGPNGAGKSTLMKIITGLWTFNSGTAEVCGIKAEKADSLFGKEQRMPHSVTAHIGYLPENNPLYEEMYVREYLSFMARLGTGRTDNKSVEEVIEKVGLLPEAEKKTGWLSKGYRQRVGLAQALLQNPQLLILDEPTTGLDPNQLKDIRELIKSLGQNRTVILSTHIMQEVKQMCNRVIIIDKGRIKADVRDLDGLDLEELFRSNTTTDYE